MSLDNDALDALARREIGELHALFEGWYRGELPPEPGIFARFEDALGEPFFLVDPGGTLEEREAIVDAVRRGHGGRPDVAIRIRDARLRWRSGELLGASYEEWQRDGDGPERGRLSSVVLRLDVRAPSGLRWLQVHETWLP